MIVFFTILFVLIGINALMMAFTIFNVRGRFKRPEGSTRTSVTAKIFPIDLISSKYKKAV